VAGLDGSRWPAFRNALARGDDLEMVRNFVAFRFQDASVAWLRRRLLAGKGFRAERMKLALVWAEARTLQHMAGTDAPGAIVVLGRHYDVGESLPQGAAVAVSRQPGVGKVQCCVATRREYLQVLHDVAQAAHQHTVFVDEEHRELGRFVEEIRAAMRTHADG
jgi:hypothetical protein